MILDEVLMLIGAIMIVVSWSPQLIKILKTKNSRNISIPFLVMLITGMILLIPHSIAISDIYFTYLNISAATIASAVLILSIKYRKGR